MSNTYKALSEWGKHRFGEDVVDVDLDPADERDLIDGHHIEIVPRTYRRVSDNYEAAGVPRGGTFERAYPIELESMLVGGGHIERVEPEPEPPHPPPDDDSGDDDVPDPAPKKPTKKSAAKKASA